MRVEAAPRARRHRAAPCPPPLTKLARQQHRERGYHEQEEPARPLQPLQPAAQTDDMPPHSTAYPFRWDHLRIGLAVGIALRAECDPIGELEALDHSVADQAVAGIDRSECDRRADSYM